MLNKLVSHIRKYDLLQPGDVVYCAVSGGADSMALLWGLYLLREKLNISLRAAHFNHHLRGEESNRDEVFVRDFCHRFDIPLTVGEGIVTPGKKGLEAAARDARYAFLRALPGKVATAHTADDNAETLLMHLVRGTGLKGLGGIAPRNGNVIRPMLRCTRLQVLSFLQEYAIGFVEDSSNETDLFLRNRLRHHVMPLLKEENPKLAENLSAMALRLRQDEAALDHCAQFDVLPSVSQLQSAEPALRARMLERFLKQCGVKEPESEHIALAESLIFSKNPSAQAHFPGNITLCRNYDRLEKQGNLSPLAITPLTPGSTVVLAEPGLRITCRQADAIINTANIFTVCPEGDIYLRSRQSGDAIRLPSGTKLLKKLFIDKKIPADLRQRIPVFCDRRGILGVWSVGVHADRAAAALPALQIHIESIQPSEQLTHREV